MMKKIGIAVVSGLLMMATALPTFAASGAWQHDHRGWRWENTNKSYATSQWIEDKGVWYYLDQDGYMVANSWKEVNGSWYYFLGSGAMASNQWIQDKYYMGASGAMLKMAIQWMQMELGMQAFQRRMWPQHQVEIRKQDLEAAKIQPVQQHQAVHLQQLQHQIQVQRSHPTHIR